MLVKNFISNNGNAIPNQFIIEAQNGTYFQSYQTMIAFKDNTGKVFLSKDWNYSKTTGKYRNIFLNETIAETRKKIKSGKYTVVDEITAEG